MGRNWRSVVLLILLLGPFAAYMGLGALWLYERGWAFYAFMAWIVAGVVFGVLANRWTRSRRQILPPIDWEAPGTFSDFDRQAWALVEQEAERGDALPMDALSGMDVYIDTGRRLAQRLAAHYEPLSTNPVEHVPVVEILTALELAAEDLTDLCRQIPGGDLVTYAHWKRAVQASGYISRANEIYNYLLPIFQPVGGLVRLGAQKLMVQPAWKSMQQNVMRWFFRAYVNRLGHHLIELYSHRLAIGAEQYRRLTRKGLRRLQEAEAGPGPMVIAVAGARDSGKTTLIAALENARVGDLGLVRARLDAAGFDPALADLLATAEVVEVSSYTAREGGESARDRSTRADAVAEAVDADFLLLVVDGTRENLSADARFVDDWDAWYAKSRGLERPAALAVVTRIDRIDPEANGRARHEAAIKARVDAIRAAMPAAVGDVLPVDLHAKPPTGVNDRLLPALALLLHRAEHTALIRHLHSFSARSKARRFLSQVGRQGRRLWAGVKDRGGARVHAR